MKKIKILFVLFGIFILSFSNQVNCLADDCSLGRKPGGIYPMYNTDVEIVREDIHVYVEEGKTVCEFEFKNTGKESDVLMGFPAEKKLVGDLDTKENLTIHDFKTFVQGKEIPVTLEKGVSSEELNDEEKSKYSSWYVFKVHFDENETKIVKNTYSFAKTMYSTGEVYLEYILDTGAYWKGNIGYAKVYFDMGDIKPYQIQSNNTPRESNYTSFDNLTFDGHNLVFEKSNFEPDFNLFVVYNIRNYTKQFIDMIGEDYKKQVNENIEYFNKIEECIKNKDKDKLLYYYDDVENTNLDVDTMRKYISDALSKIEASNGNMEKQTNKQFAIVIGVLIVVLMSITTIILRKRNRKHSI